jgi:hypothetical protein
MELDGFENCMIIVIIESGHFETHMHKHTHTQEDVKE